MCSSISPIMDNLSLEEFETEVINTDPQTYQRYGLGIQMTPLLFKRQNTAISPYGPSIQITLP